MKKETYIIWKYDHFPYMLCAKLISINADGMVKVEGYGGMTFKPMHIISKEQGEKMIKLINEIQIEKRSAQQKLDDDFSKRLRIAKDFILNP